MLQKKSFYRIESVSLIIVLFLLFLSNESFCQKSNPDNAFFNNIEKSLRAEYKKCTGDLSTKPLNTLLEWKKSIDSLLVLPQYPDLFKRYCMETDIKPEDVYPCDILEWQRRKLRQKTETEELFRKYVKHITMKKSDSVFARKEITKIKRTVFDFHDIPFGISKRSFNFLAEQSELKKSQNRNNYVELDSITLGDFVYKGAFHFDTNNYYYKYELESQTFPLDSLDRKVRLIADNLIFNLKKKTGKSPDHVYRVGRFDIVSGRLSILALWRIENISAYVGLATYKYEYYAKIIVTCKIKPESDN